ncbi:MAG TPA: ABC transporter ATP-binding protein [Candidatus Tumulicola sp.]|nr:ABC transporter ATP-binding protein [Candidatus Tumulicola sp.]
MFNEVGLTLEHGRLVALIGPNGAGKSSLLRVLAGLQKPSSGVVQTTARASLIATATPLPADVTPAELASYARAVRRPWWQQLQTTEDKLAIASALERTGLAQRADDSASMLSDGEVQRAWIAAALAANTEVLLIDEPTTHLDLRYQLEALRTLKTLARGGAAVMVAIHDLTLAARFADRIALLAEGALVTGAPEEVLQPAALSRAFGVEVSTHRDPEGNLICTPM